MTCSEPSPRESKQPKTFMLSRPAVFRGTGILFRSTAAGRAVCQGAGNVGGRRGQRLMKIYRLNQRVVPTLANMLPATGYLLRTFMAPP